jgi:hypothetical protein
VGRFSKGYDYTIRYYNQYRTETDAVFSEMSRPLPFIPPSRSLGAVGRPAGAACPSAQIRWTIYPCPFRLPPKPIGLALLFTAALTAQFNPHLYQALRWRQIGPFRAGRVIAVAGIPGNAAIYYMGALGGGLWKTFDGDVAWTPIFDQVPISSIGAIAVSESKPDVVYVGTGDVSIVGGP